MSDKAFAAVADKGDNGKSHRYDEKQDFYGLFEAVDLDSKQEVSNKVLKDCTLIIAESPVQLAGDFLVVGGNRFPSEKEVQNHFQEQTELLTNLLTALKNAPVGSLIFKGVGSEVHVVEPVDGNKVFTNGGWEDPEVTGVGFKELLNRVDLLTAELAVTKSRLANAVDINTIRQAGE